MFLEDAGLCTDFFVTHSTNNSDKYFQQYYEDPNMGR